MVNSKLPGRLLSRAFNAVQASNAAAGQQLGQHLGAQTSHQPLEQIRGKAQAATATRQSTPTYTIPVADIKTDLFGAVSAVNEVDVVQEGVFQVGGESALALCGCVETTQHSPTTEKRYAARCHSATNAHATQYQQRENTTRPAALHLWSTTCPCFDMKTRPECEHLCVPTHIHTCIYMQVHTCSAH